MFFIKGVTGEAVKIAIKAGYRMIDCANDYGNEGEIGKAIKECIAEGIVKRKQHFNLPLVLNEHFI